MQGFRKIVLQVEDIGTGQREEKGPDIGVSQYC